MTLLIAVLCSDGAVIGADRQATHGSLGTATVGQPVTKVSILGSDALFASSGYIGMAQQYEAFVSNLLKDSYFARNDYSIAIRRIQDHFRPIAEGAFKTAAAAVQILGHAAQADCICGCLLATVFKDGEKIVEITPQISVEFLTPELSFLSMGSGKAAADPFLGFLKSIFWPHRLPTVREGALAAYWAIQLATQLRISGVGMGIDIFTLEKSDAKWAARKLDDNEMAEHDAFIASCTDALRGVSGAIAGESAAEEDIRVPEP